MNRRSFFGNAEKTAPEDICFAFKLPGRIEILCDGNVTNGMVLSDHQMKTLPGQGRERFGWRK